MSSENIIHGDVGIVAEGDVIQNNSNVIHLGAATLPALKPLIDAQRSHLNELVRKIIELKPETPRWQIWKGVHREVGADSIDEMTTAQYPDAVSCLTRMIDSCDEEAQCHLMVRRVIALTQDSQHDHERAVTWCIDHYGKDRFLDLDRSELRELLAALPKLAEVELAARCDHDCVTCRAQTSRQHDTALARANVTANNDIQRIRQAADVRLKKVSTDFAAFKDKTMREYRQREQNLQSALKTQRERAMQWIVATALAGMSSGVALGAWIL
ncbi:hypothetical protein [Silvimonas sp.]|uniref:hypothetical protein n=1 Tax=Silvimonas sp. TaxID=2650811 RepID=UPI00284FC25A|nr:hypothetical protein [Silvimonas sp.]MDR3429699.1 hypothetical protein [Silvimonas sp.]